MAIATDFEIQQDKDIRYIGTAHEGAGAGYYTVLELHQWLQGLADDASSSPDDFLDITRDTPSDKSFDTIINIINGYNIDDTAAEHLYGGSIIQSGGDEIYDGLQVLANEGCFVEIVQNGSIIANDFWNSVPDGESVPGLNRDVANGISARFLIKVRTAAADIDGRRLICQTREFGYTYSEFKINGTGRGVTAVPLTYALDLNNETAEGTVSGWTGITNGKEGYSAIDVDNDAVDEYYYSNWDRSTYTINQFYERMKWLIRRGSTSTMYGFTSEGALFRGITHQVAITPGTGTWVEPEDLSWGTGATAGTGKLLAVDDTDATGTSMLWLQLVTGVPPNANTITGNGGATGTAGAVTERVLSFPFCGASTGSAIVGAYGFGIEYADLAVNDKMISLAGGSPKSPPNNQTFYLGGIRASDDYCVIGPLGYRFYYDNEGGTPPFTVGEQLTFGTPGTAILAELRDYGTYGEMVIGPILTGSLPADDDTISGDTSGATGDVNGTPTAAINTRQFTLNGALTGGAVTSVVVTEAIPVDTPGSGTIRILRANGVYTRHPYSVWDGPTKTFTITSHDFSTNNANDDTNVFISYIDKTASSGTESYTATYVSSRDLFIRVRSGTVNPPYSPIKTFESTGTFGAAGGTATAVRTYDG
jgi:hypothetical protein